MNEPLTIAVRNWWCRLAMSVGALAAGGCGVVGESLPKDVVDGNRDQTLLSSNGTTSGEPNDTFAEAIIAVFDKSNIARLQGVISERGDLDVYNLGPLASGDRVIVETQASSAFDALDASIALFDAQENLFVGNDDDGTSLDPFVDEVVRHDSDAYFLVVGASSFAARSNRTGSYQIDIRVVGSQPLPPPKGQTIFLDFDGGVVSASNLGVSQVSPFDAGEIDGRYAGRTELIKSFIVETVGQNFERFNVTLITSDETDSPEGPFTTVLFGGFNRFAFGISEGVDQHNADAEDTAIIFTESFAPEVFLGPPPTAEELGVAIGNVAAHEAGHLLGLNHVDEPTALMDATSPADSFLLDQEFKRAPLSGDILPIGAQDALILLSEILGLL